jgi:hypothetical protein
VLLAALLFVLLVVRHSNPGVREIATADARTRSEGSWRNTNVRHFLGEKEFTSTINAKLDYVGQRAEGEMIIGSVRYTLVRRGSTGWVNGGGPCWVKLTDQGPAVAVDDLSISPRDVAVGEQMTLRGTSVTHYPVVRRRPRVKIAAMPESGEPVMGSTTVTDVWLDDNGRIRQIREEISITDGPDVVSLTEIYDFGVTVEAIPPPTDKVDGEGCP